MPLFTNRILNSYLLSVPSMGFAGPREEMIHEHNYCNLFYEIFISSIYLIIYKYKHKYFYSYYVQIFFTANSSIVS